MESQRFLNVLFTKKYAYCVCVVIEVKIKAAESWRRAKTIAKVKWFGIMVFIMLVNQFVDESVTTQEIFMSFFTDCTDMRQ